MINEKCILLLETLPVKKREKASGGRQEAGGGELTFPGPKP